MSLEERFQAAAEIVQKLPTTGPVTTTNDEKLVFYSLYKQATIGKTNTPRPSFYQLVEKSKWDAWNALGDMPQEEAKEKYVAELQKMLERVAETMDVLEWLRSTNTDPDLPAKFALLGR